jgi:hypothetical protein
MMRAPAVHLETKEVAVRLDTLPDELIADAVIKAFNERTGWRLRLQTPQATLSQQHVTSSALETTPATASQAARHRLRIRPHVNTFDLVEIVRKLAPKEWRLLKQPSLHSDQGMARIKVAVAPPAEELADVCERYDEMTGFRLDVAT